MGCGVSLARSNAAWHVLFMLDLIQIYNILCPKLLTEKGVNQMPVAPQADCLASRFLHLCSLPPRASVCNLAEQAEESRVFHTCLDLPEPAPCSLPMALVPRQKMLIAGGVVVALLIIAGVLGFKGCGAAVDNTFAAGATAAVV